MTDLSALSISQLQAESVRLQSLLGEQEAHVATTRAHLQAAHAELSKRLRPTPSPRVSDHAILRFLERIMGLDVKAIRARIMTDTVKDAIRSGACAVTVEGVRMRIVDNTIVTVLDKPDRSRMPKDVTADEGPSLQEAMRDAIEDTLEARALVLGEGH